LIEFGRETIEEAFEKKDAEAIGEAGQDECAEGVKEAEIGVHEEIRDHGNVADDGFVVAEEGRPEAEFAA